MKNGQLQCIICALVAASLSLSLFGENGRGRRQETSTPGVCPVENLAPGGSLATKRAQRAALEEKLAAVESEEDVLTAKEAEARNKFAYGNDNTRAADKRKWNAAKAKLEAKQQEAAALVAAMAGLPEIKSAPPKNKAEYAKLIRSKKAALLEELLEQLDSAPTGRSEHEGYKFTIVELKSWDDAIYDPFGKKILAAFKSDSGDLPDTQEDQIRVGEPKGTVGVVRLADGTPVGGLVHMMQSGASKEDGDGEYHSDVATWQQAKSAGFHDNDVSWSMGLKFGENGEALEDQDSYWDWTGH